MCPLPDSSINITFTVPLPPKVLSFYNEHYWDHTVNWYDHEYFNLITNTENSVVPYLVLIRQCRVLVQFYNKMSTSWLKTKHIHTQKNPLNPTRTFQNHHLKACEIRSRNFFTAIGTVESICLSMFWRAKYDNPPCIERITGTFV